MTKIAYITTVSLFFIISESFVFKWDSLKKMNMVLEENRVRTFFRHRIFGGKLNKTENSTKKLNLTNGHIHKHFPLYLLYNGTIIRKFQKLNHTNSHTFGKGGNISKEGNAQFVKSHRKIVKNGENKTKIGGSDGKVIVEETKGYQIDLDAFYRMINPMVKMVKDFINKMPKEFPRVKFNKEYIYQNIYPVLLFMLVMYISLLPLYVLIAFWLFTWRKADKIEQVLI